MSNADNDVKFLGQTKEHFGLKVPPFNRTGMAKTQGKVRILDGNSYQTIGQGSYKAGKRKITYATLKLRGEYFIVMPLPKGWKGGDPINKYGYKYWYAWQGPEDTFRGPRFDGPVAFSVDAVEYGHETEKGSPEEKNVPEPDTESEKESAEDSADGMAGAQPEEDSAEGVQEEVAGTEREEDAAEEVDRGMADMESVPIMDALVPLEPLRSFTPLQETATWIRIVINKDRQLHLPMRLKAARPDDDGPVTLESFFEKVVPKFGPRNTQVDLIHATFDRGSVHDDEVFHNTETQMGAPRMLHRTAKDAWDSFVARVVFYITVPRHIPWHNTLMAYEG